MRADVDPARDLAPPTAAAPDEGRLGLTRAPERAIDAPVELALALPIRGLVIGFTIAAAVGPITLLVVRRTIDHGGVYGFAAGLGVASADATYGAIAAFGLTAITSLLVSN